MFVHVHGHENAGMPKSMAVSPPLTWASPEVCEELAAEQCTVGTGHSVGNLW